MNTEDKGRYYEVNGVRLYVEEAGSGPPMVFLHGVTLDLTYWRPIMQAFSGSHRVIAYDLRGCGRSGGATPPYSFDALVRDLDALLDQLGVERPILCGHSMGGNLGLQYTALHPERVAALVAADAPGLCNLVTSRPGLALFRLGLSLGRLLGFNPPQKPTIPLCRWLFWSKEFRDNHPEVLDAWRRQYLAATPVGLRTSSRALANRPRNDRIFARITCPTLLLRGGDDRVVPQRDQVRYLKDLPNASLEILAGSGHMTLSEQPVEFSRLVADFLSSLGYGAKAGPAA